MVERPNGPSQEETEQVVKTVEGYMSDLKAEKALYMNRCKPLHEAIKDTIQDAVKSKGFDKKALKITVQQREFLRKMEALENELDEVTQTALDRLQSQLGTFADSPLGKAAMDAARGDGARKPRRPREPAKRRNPLDELIGDEPQAEEYGASPVDD
jgi:uncharacterized protein (UPF0335 family)